MSKTDASTGKSLTYSQLSRSIRSIASGLRKRGLKINDSVVIMGSDFVEVPLISLGNWRAGGCQACFTVNLADGNSKL